MTEKFLYINTIGCQMNVYDSGQIEKGLEPLGYRPVASPDKADLIIMNTCAIREKAEQKVFSFLGRLAALKKKRPDLIVGVGGCVAQQEGEKILQRVPWVDLVFGTRALSRLPKLVKRVSTKRCRIVDVEMSGPLEMQETLSDGFDEVITTRFVTIMQGCDNYCTYCVVPYVRGREESRLPEHIISEVTGLVSAGVKEITLLGQNVNSYGKKEKLCTFPQLLQQINEIERLERIRYTTSHPKDLSESLIQCFKDLDKLCRHIHLPVQSGSNAILKKMNRKYTRERYLSLIEKLRSTCSDIAVTTDIIVGFPGETAEDFSQTLDLIRRVEFDGLFAFKYSDRPNAPAAGFEGKLREGEKKERLQEVLDLQGGVTRHKHQTLVGSIQSVLVEGLSKRQVGSDRLEQAGGMEWAGRTPHNRIVNFTIEDERYSMEKAFTGKLVSVRIEKAHSHSLWGRLAVVRPDSIDLKGEKSNAA